MGNNEARASDTEKTGRNERISGSVSDRFKEAARLFSLYFRIPILVSRREDFPLGEFRQGAVFMEKAQPFYGEAYLTALLAGEQQKMIQVLDDPLGTCAVLVLAEDMAALFGPFVQTPYQEKNSRHLLSRFVRFDDRLLLQFKLFWCDLSVCEAEEVGRAAHAMLEYAGFSEQDFPVSFSRTEKRGGRPPAQVEPAALPAWQRDALQRVEERYAVETELMASIGDGNEEAAIASLRRIRTTSRPQTGMTVDLWPQESATAIMRNMIRLAAKSSGLDSTVIDSISLDYAQKMRLPAADLRATGRLYENMISDLCREIRRMKETGYSPLTRKALHVIQKHCAEPLTIGGLAELLRVSESTLGRSLKADTGLTFTRLLQAERMAAAARLLTATSEPVQVIAARVGIPDQNYFVKVFRGAFHVTPSEYRNGLFTEGR